MEPTKPMVNLGALRRLGKVITWWRPECENQPPEPQTPIGFEAWDGQASHLGPEFSIFGPKTAEKNQGSPLGGNEPILGLSLPCGQKVEPCLNLSQTFTHSKKAEAVSLGDLGCKSVRLSVPKIALRPFVTCRFYSQGTW